MKKVHYGWVIVGAGVLVKMSGLGFGRFAYPMLLSNMREGLGFTYARMGLLSGGILLGYLIFSFVGGVLATRFGARRVVVASLVCSSFSMLCLSQVSHFYLLLFFMFTMGGAAAGVHISMTTIAMAWFEKRHLGRAVGVVTGGTGLGILVTGLFLPSILVSLGPEAWRRCWIFMAGITFLVFVLCFFFLKDRPAQGFLSSLEGAEGRPPVAVKKEKEVMSLRMIFIVYFIFGFSYNLYATYFVAFMKEGVGLSERVAGNIWAIFGWTGMLSGLVWGFLSDRMGRRKALLWNIGVISFAVLLPLLFQKPFLLGTSTFLFGFTFLGAVTIVAAFIGDRVGERRASVYGILTLVHGVGQLLGTLSGGYMRDWTRSFQTLLISSLVGLVLCLVLVVFYKK